MPILQFSPHTSLVQPAFWHELTRLKIDVLKLSQDSVPVIASYGPGRSVIDREVGKEITLGGSLSVSGDGFDQDARIPQHAALSHGTLKNYNTIEDFKAADKSALFNETADKIWSSIFSSKDPTQLSRFLLITFADLKKYKYYYWFAFPALVAKPAWEIHDDGWVEAQNILGTESLASILTALQERSPQLPYFLARPSPDSSSYEIAPVSEYETFFANTPEDSRIVSFIDSSPHIQNPGWPLRNLLAYLRFHHPDSTRTLRILSWRDTEAPTAGKKWRSRVGAISVAERTDGDALGARPTAVGWEKNAQGKLAPRVADLGGMMDPRRLADQAVDLNLKLMRWRILPELDLEKVANTKCLLLGAGTLGCYVARVLMGWGVRTITLLDSSRVSFSNPVRQPLFEFEDCLDGGKPKAQCAADRMKKIFPGVNATGVSLNIPMPGHPVAPASVSQVQADVAKLEKLVDEHDAVFLLMDSRESRWLPTVLGAAKGKIVLNAALGFDTYLVMRHGARASAVPEGATRLGCYYCNDIVAPADSLTDRTLDQMCTVTRPGLASIAAATAVELLVSVLQHPAGLHASPPPGGASDVPGTPQGEDGVLGLVPHQLRGYLAQFRNMLITGAAYNRCTGCSETVINAYEAQGFDMLLNAFNEQGYLEKLTGLDQLYDEGEAALESVDWDEEDEADADF
ncbi:E1-like protein-activating [Ramaria rubella]|nr:E1-like protein-activating [Ramaria rubella]